MKYYYLATAVFLTTLSAMVVIVAHYHPMYEIDLNFAAHSLIVGIALFSMYQIEQIKETM